MRPSPQPPTARHPLPELDSINAVADAADGNAGYMERVPSQPCWEGRHWLFAGASVITIALLYPVMIHFERKRQSAAEVSYHVRFTACACDIGVKPPRHGSLHLASSHLNDSVNTCACCRHAHWQARPLGLLGAARFECVPHMPPWRRAQPLSTWLGRRLGNRLTDAFRSRLPTELPPAAYLLCCMAMLVFFLHINNQREQDNQPACCNVHTVRRLRSLLLTCALWTTSTTLASTVLEISNCTLLTES